MFEEENAQWGLVHALVLDGKGGARSIARTELDDLQLQPQESLWLHWDRSHPQTQTWLRKASGLSEFACDLLLEENTRPRLLSLPDPSCCCSCVASTSTRGRARRHGLGAHFAAARRDFLRLRPLRATDELLVQLADGKGPKTASELILYMAQYLTLKVQDLVTDLSEIVDAEEEKLDTDERYTPEHGSILQIRRRAAGLKRFLAPQRDIFGQLTRIKLAWFCDDDADYWNELNNSLTRYLEELELTRERVGLVLEAEDRRLSVRMNRTMYRFGIITGIFLPMSFLTGLLGINVGGIPFSASPYGFVIACLLMVSVALGQWWLFRRLRWV
jgi:zinc transporter